VKLPKTALTSLAILGGCVVSAPGAGAAAMPGGLIVFAHATSLGGPRDIYTMWPRGGHLRQLTSGHDDRQPRFSPDGSHIVFSSLRDGAVNVYEMDADGSNVVQLTTSDGTSSNSAPDYTPDGRIVFLHSTGIVGEVWTMNADGGNQQRMFGGDWFSHPSASSRGEIAFVNNSSMPALSLAGESGMRNLAADPTQNTMFGDPSFSPDGSRVAFTRADFGTNVWQASHLYRMRRTGTGLRQLTDTVHRSDRMGDWSPDGRWIVFDACSYPYGCEDRSVTGKIWAVQANGMHAHALDDFQGETPDWGPAA
jgi:Tol biopolymer transport system component